MTIIDLERGAPVNRPPGAYVTPGLNEADSDAPEFSTLFGATWRQENIFGSAAARHSGISNDDEPDLKPFEEIKGTIYEPYWDAFVGVRNRSQLSAVRQNIDRELADRKIIDAAPFWMSVPASLLANVVDPTILVPGGAFVRGAKGGFSIAKSALNMGVATGTGVAIQEAGLHATQATRTPMESAVNIGAGVMLGGLIGTGGAKLFTRAEWKAATDAIERDIADQIDPLIQAVPDARAPGPAGAAAVEPASKDALTIAGFGGVVAQATQFNPGLRLMNSENPVARQIGANLFEMTQYLRGNQDGIATPTAVETLRKEWNAGLMVASQDTQQAWKAYRQAGGPLKREDFNQAVGRAMRRSDADPIPEVAKAAQSWRKNVFDPLKDAAIEGKLLPEDVAVDTAPSYFSRLWNRKRLIAEEGSFKQVVNEYYSNLISRSFKGESEKFSKRMAALDQEVADLNLPADARAKTLHELEQSAYEHEAQWPTLSEAADQLSEIRSQMRAVRRDKDKMKTADFETAIADLKKQSDAVFKSFPEEALQAFIAKRTELSSRRRHVDLGVAGLMDRSDRVLNQIADIEESNFRAMDRLIKKGQKLERDLDRLDADALETRIDDLATSYGKLAKKADASVERARQQIENINKRAAAKEVRNIEAGAEISAESDNLIKARVNQEAIRQQQFSERMQAIADRLQIAKSFDHDGMMEAIKDSVVRATRETSVQSMARGERAARLGERMANLDPKKVEARVKTIADMKQKAEAAFFDKWEVRRSGENIDWRAPSDAKFQEHAKAIADDAYDTLIGRTSEGPRPEFITIKARGPLKERTFNIPDELVERWLESDIDIVGRRYHRIMSADVELARKFGSVDMADQIAAIRAGYDKLRAGLSDEKELSRLAKEEAADIRDIEGVRDLMRGTFAHSQWERDFGRIARVANGFNYVRMMGGVVMSSLTDALRIPMTQGIRPFMEGAFQGLAHRGAFKLSVREAQLAGNINERVLANRMATLAEINDYYTSRGPVEKFMENMTNLASNWNGIRLWTDSTKMLASVVVQNRILDNVSRFANLSAKDKRYLAFVHIDESMAGRIAAQFEKHGETIDGVRVAGTAKWDDEVARRAYRAAMNKDIDSTIVTKSVADLPLWANTPLGKLVLQFNTFNLASHQRILLRGLQEDKVRFLGSMIALTSMGMLSTYLAGIASNRLDKMPDIATNPGWWIGEGLDRSGVLSVPFQLANGMEKLVGFNPIKSPMKIADEGRQQSDRIRNRNEVSFLGGPSVGLLQDVANTTGIAKKWIEGEDANKAQLNSAERLIPFNSYLGVRQMFKYVVNPPED